MAVPLAQAVKSRLLPLSAWVKTMERLTECLPRRLISVQLNPLHDVAVVDLASEKYRARGSAPSFTLTLGAEPAECGWYYLEAALVRHNGSRSASISADVQHQGSASITI